MLSIITTALGFLDKLPGAAISLADRSKRWAKEDRAEIDATFKAEIDNLNAQLADAGDDEERAAIKVEIKHVHREQRQFYRARRELLLSKSLVERLTPRGIIAAGEPQLAEADRELLKAAASVVARLEPPQTFEDHFLQGNAFYTAEDYEKALVTYNRALELRPDDPATLNNRGLTLHELQRHDEALADLNRSLQLRPDDPDTLYNRGNTLAKLERYDEALADYNRALQLRPEHPNTLNNRGLTYHHVEGYGEALTDYNCALELRPDDPVTLSNRGGTLHQLQRYDEALADYNRALQLHPDHPATLNNRGLTLHQLQRYDEALADYNRAVELAPDHPRPVYDKACLFSLTGRLPESLEQLKEAIARDSENRALARQDEDFNNVRFDPTLGQEFERLVAEPDA